MLATRRVRPIPGTHLRGGGRVGSGLAAGRQRRERTWAGVLARSPVPGSTASSGIEVTPGSTEARTLSLCPNLELSKCDLARWRRELRRQPGLRNPSPAALTPALSLVSNVNLPDSGDFAQNPKPSVPHAAAVVTAVWLRLVGITNSN